MKDVSPRHLMYNPHPYPQKPCNCQHRLIVMYFTWHWPLNYFLKECLTLITVLWCYSEPVFNYPASRGPSIDCWQGSIQLFSLHNCLLLWFHHFCQKSATRLAQVGEHRSATTNFPANCGANHNQLLHFCTKNKVVVVVGLNPGRTNNKGLLKKLVRSFWLWFETLSQFKSWRSRHWQVSSDCGLSSVKSKGT